jgi:hypothetical protein
MSRIPEGRLCDNCGGVIEDDGFCSWHGALDPDKETPKWMCDDCTAHYRGNGQPPFPFLVDKPPMDRNKIELELDKVRGAIRNMGSIQNIIGHDVGWANRDLDVTLDWKESKPVYQALIKVLEAKIERIAQLIKQEQIKQLEHLRELERTGQLS